MRQIITKLLLVVALLVLLLIAVAAAGSYWFITRSHPQTSGTLHLPGLMNRVEVIRDQNGVPHIYAENTDDLFMAQGFVQAQDRLWQMEFNRHVGHGRLAELFGKDLVDEDEFLRTIGLDAAAHRDVEQLGPQLRGYLQRFADGVNAYLRMNADNLPIEFVLLGYKPEDWQPVDTLVWGKVMAYNLGGNYQAELLRAALIKELGPELVRQINPPYPSDAPVIIPLEAKNYAVISSLTPRPSLTPSPSPMGRGEPPSPPAPSPTGRGEKIVDIGTPDLARVDAINELLGKFDGIGSNNWVVDGTRTTTGKPLLANDPHLGIQMPSIWYLNALHCVPVSDGCPFNVIGFTFPGVPGVVLGHNDHIAWAVTNLPADVQDLYIEKINPVNPSQYEYKGKWEDMEISQDVIHVKGGADVPLVIRRTRHGPILTQVLEGVTEPLALQWTATRQVGTVFQAVLGINRARNWDEFREAARLWDVPPQNLLYADVDGNIGYQMPGTVPIRAQGNGSVPVPGWSGEYEWIGYIPFDELPFVFNPPTHSIVTANNKIVPEGYKYFIARDWAAPFRAARIQDLLKAKDKLSPEDFKAFQGDVYSISLVKLQQYLLNVPTDNFLTRRALPYVQQWDGYLTRESIGAAILESTYSLLVDELFKTRLSEKTFSAYKAASDAHRLFVDQLLDDPQNALWDNPETAAKETRDDVLPKVYAKSVDDLGRRFGDWPPDWHWGRLHTATFEHTFGSKPPLDLLFNYGPIQVPGDGYTVFNTGFNAAKGYADRTVSSMRHIANMANLDQSVWIHTTGQSGQPLNWHYSDLVSKWRDGEYEPLAFTHGEVEKNTANVLVLTP